MNKEFVPYEEALALKELGFNEDCLCTMYTDIEWNKRFKNPIKTLYIGCGNKEADSVLLKDTQKFINSPVVDYYITIPLYQQAFRWFREKYNLDSFVKHLYKSTIKVGYYFGIDEYKGVEFQMDFDAWYKTYEEAELACLIKLIEIVKEK
jgi:hypothetical protein